MSFREYRYLGCGNYNTPYMDYKQMVDQKNKIDIAFIHIQELIRYLNIPQGLVLENFETISIVVFRGVDGELILENPPTHQDDNFNTVKDYTTWSGRRICFDFIGEMSSDLCKKLQDYCNSKQPQLLIRGVLYDSIVKYTYTKNDCNTLRYKLTFYILETEKREVKKGIIRKKKVRKSNEDIGNLIFFNEMEVMI